jgi:hypothetical protein
LVATSEALHLRYAIGVWILAPLSLGFDFWEELMDQAGQVGIAVVPYHDEDPGWMGQETNLAAMMTVLELVNGTSRAIILY